MLTLRLSRDLDVQHRTAVVLAHKIRESLMDLRDETELDGEGAFVNGQVRPKYKKEDRVDRLLAENQKADKRCVFVMRSRHGADGAAKCGCRTLTFVMKRESQAGALRLAGHFVRKGSTVFVDEAPANNPQTTLYRSLRGPPVARSCAAADLHE